MNKGYGYAMQSMINAQNRRNHQTMRLSESQLRQIVVESVKKVLTEIIQPRHPDEIPDPLPDNPEKAYRVFYADGTSASNGCLSKEQAMKLAKAIESRGYAVKVAKQHPELWNGMYNAWEVVYRGG